VLAATVPLHQILPSSAPDIQKPSMSSICFNSGQAFCQLPNALMREYILKSASLQNHWTHILEPTSEMRQLPAVGTNVPQITPLVVLSPCSPAIQAA